MVDSGRVLVTLEWRLCAFELPCLRCMSPGCQDVGDEDVDDIGYQSPGQSKDGDWDSHHIPWLIYSTASASSTKSCRRGGA